MVTKNQKTKLKQSHDFGENFVLKALASSFVCLHSFANKKFGADDNFFKYFSLMGEKKSISVFLFCHRDEDAGSEVLQCRDLQLGELLWSTFLPSICFCSGSFQ